MRRYWAFLLLFGGPSFAWNANHPAGRKAISLRSDPEDGVSREKAIQIMGSLLGINILSSEESLAAAPLDAGEAIRRSAANIPGYGQTDVFFPSSLAGTWKATREIDFGNGREPLRVTYPFRFIPAIEDGAVVADRGVNQAELEAAVVKAIKGSDVSNPVLSQHLSSSARQNAIQDAHELQRVLW